MTIEKRHIYLFWGVMDLIYVLGFLYGNYSRSRIPFYDDMLSFTTVDLGYGGYMPKILFACSLLLSVSIFMTMFLFFKKNKFARPAASLQAPLRLFLVVPSLSFIPWLVSVFELKHVLIIFALLITSEVFKLVSLWLSPTRAGKALR